MISNSGTLDELGETNKNPEAWFCYRQWRSLCWRFQACLSSNLILHIPRSAMIDCYPDLLQGQDIKTSLTPKKVIDVPSIGVDNSISGCRLNTMHRPAGMKSAWISGFIALQQVMLVYFKSCQIITAFWRFWQLRWFTPYSGYSCFL